MISFRGVSFHYTGEMILEDITFELEKNDKAGLIGRNGCGKTTLFKLVSGELSPVSGTINIYRDRKIGWLRQEDSITGEKNLFDSALEAFAGLMKLEEEIAKLSEMISSEHDIEKQHLYAARLSLLNDEYIAGGGASYRNRVTGVLKGLGFTEEQFSMPAYNLSGGQKTRLALSRLLLQKPDILLLDEPTNHLDTDSTEWLESFLCDYEGLVLIISHDRYFLDRTTKKIIELENRQACVYKGNYTASRKTKEEKLKADEAAYAKKNAEIRHLKSVISKLKQFNREKSVKRARSFEKKLAKTGDALKPAKDSRSIRLDFSGDISGTRDILEVNELSKRYDALTLFSGLSFSLARGNRLFILGANGTGKSTLLKIITGSIAQDAGYFRLADTIETGYYDQAQTFEDHGVTLFEELSGSFPGLTKQQVIEALAGMLFTAEDNSKKISELSGGERARVALLKLMLSSPDLLILDEPTNHLDIYARERLEEALSEYKGTLLCVSHDRYFTGRLATRVLFLYRGRHMIYNYGYEEYLSRRNELAETDNGKTVELSEAKMTFIENKKRKAMLQKTESDIFRLREKLNSLEDEIDRIDSMLACANNTSDYMELMRLSSDKESMESEYLDDLGRLHTLEDTLKEMTVI